MENAGQANFNLESRVERMERDLESTRKELMEERAERKQMDRDTRELNRKLESQTKQIDSLKSELAYHFIRLNISSTKRKPVPVAMCSFINTSAGF